MSDRPRVGHLLRSARCSECGAPFSFARKGRPRATCSPRCRHRRHHRIERERVHPVCAFCGERHAVDVRGAGYLYCAPTGWTFLPEAFLPSG